MNLTRQLRIAKEFPAVPWGDNLSSIVASSLLGRWFMSRAAGRYAIPLAVVSLPGMAYCLFGFSLALVAVVYGDSL